MDNILSFYNDSNNPETFLELNFFLKIIKNNDIVFDIGARDSNLPLLNKNAKYFLFEPIQFNYDKLLNKFGEFNNVILCNKGLSDKDETVKIYIESESINKRSDINYIWKTVNPSRVINGETEDIKLITLKTYIEENDIKKIDVMKVDVEGYEYNVIKGLYEYINIVDIILFEYSVITYTQNNVDLLNLLQLLHNFKFYLLETLKNDAILIEMTAQEIYDKFKNETYCHIIASKICLNKILTTKK